MSIINELKKNIIQLEYVIDELEDIIKIKDEKYFEIFKNKHERGYYCDLCHCDYVKIDQHLKTKMHNTAKVCYINDVEKMLKDKKKSIFELKDECNAHYEKSYGYSLYKDI